MDIDILYYFIINTCRIVDGQEYLILLCSNNYHPVGEILCADIWSVIITLTGICCLWTDLCLLSSSVDYDLWTEPNWCRKLAYYCYQDQKIRTA